MPSHLSAPGTDVPGHGVAKQDSLKLHIYRLVPFWSAITQLLSPEPCLTIPAAGEKAAFSMGNWQGRMRDGTRATASTHTTHGCQKNGNPPSTTEPFSWDFTQCVAAGYYGQAIKAIKENNQARTLMPPERLVSSRRREGVKDLGLGHR